MDKKQENTSKELYRANISPGPKSGLLEKMHFYTCSPFSSSFLSFEVDISPPATRN